MSDTNLQNQDDESSKDVKGPAGQKVGGSTVPERRDRASLAELDLFKFMPHRKTDDVASDSDGIKSDTVVSAADDRDYDDDTDPNGVAAVSESTDTSTDTVAIAEPVVVADNESGSVDTTGIDDGAENVDATGTTDVDAAATDTTDADATTDTNESEDDENLDPEEIAKRKHRRHVKIMRGIVTPVLGVLAIIAFVFGGLNATIWKPNPHVTVSTGTLSTNYVVTDPGVLALADNTVDISATAASGDQVCIAVTSARDATGWLSGQKYTRVNGLATWQSFTTQTSSTKDSGDTGTVAFADSDMWEQVSCNNDKTTLQWKGDGGDRVILVSAQGADPKANTKLDFTMSWTRATVPNFAMPFFFVGGLLTVMAILAATLFSLESHRRRKRKTLENAHVTALTEEEMLDQDGKPHWMHAGSEPPSPERSRRRERHERRRRHHSHRREAVEEELREEREAEGPEVLDVTSVNLLQQNTPAVSTDELQEYFARLAAENAANAEAADTAVDTDGADIATNNDTNPGNDDTDGTKEAK
ncbi:hypothetical protein [Bifidobacterium tissieri]|uniref:Uncharacterized protein n=1 Tax=Bifidobacterium tissieri TaxID=1630162 RepID=A0A5M9ZPK8_9BIFI|nr:hypothetical protein [Bifidobacterium tissieri]KAA8829425.1 hypothetical protein EMO89_07935 [Bifidobacterium tissieri]KAA8831386.1 hypothetical protein EM849_07880 [Bifidobacterium tissieri]